MKFITCWHPEVEGEAKFAETSLPHQMSKGWIPVESNLAEGEFEELGEVLDDEDEDFDVVEILSE